MEPVFNIQALIASLGGVKGLRERFKNVGITPPPSNTIIGWRRRNSAPGPWTLAMLYVASRDPYMPDADEILELMRDTA
jgi:hypothetical protein